MNIREEVKTMAPHDHNSNNREFSVTSTTDQVFHAERIGDLTGDEVIVKVKPGEIDSIPAVKNALGEKETPAALFVRLTDPITHQLLQEGQELWAWIRVKKNGVFFTKTAVFSLGAVAAIAIGKKVIDQHKSR